MPTPPLGSGYPAGQHCYALVRWNVATGVGTFIGLVGQSGFHAEALPAGVWRYETWMVLGANPYSAPDNAGSTQRAVYSGRAKLVVQHGKR